MFLNDINRKINKQKNGWERWDDHRTLDLEGYETVIDFVGDLSLLCVKNVGATDVNVEMKGMFTRVSQGEEKYFNEVAGRQVIVHTREPGGKVFIGQSLKGDITSKKLLSILVIALLLTGCVNMQEPEEVKRSPFATPTAPHGAPIPRTP